MEGLYWLIAVVMVGAGILGTVVPIIPGVPLVFLGLLVAAWIDGFQKVGWPTIVLLFVLTLSATIIDFVATSLGTKKAGASRGALFGAFSGMVVGLFFGIPGVILGPFLGAVLGEYLVRRDILQAGKAGLGTWVGLIIATAAKVALIFTMIAIFALAYLL